MPCRINSKFSDKTRNFLFFSQILHFFLTVQQSDSIPKTLRMSDMKKVRVFLSFEFERDNELHHNFYSRAARCSQYERVAGQF